MQQIEFFYNKFFYNNNVLTPRLETESLVREAISVIKKENIKTLIDIGTGSGIIPISVGKNIKLDKIIAVDKSKKALEIAKLNAEKLGVTIDFFESDLLRIKRLKNPHPDPLPEGEGEILSGIRSPVSSGARQGGRRIKSQDFKNYSSYELIVRQAHYDTLEKGQIFSLKNKRVKAEDSSPASGIRMTNNILITANLPYVKKNDWENMSEDTRSEPKMALFGGEKTGFELYERFFRQVLKIQKEHKGKLILLCEIGYDQKEVASKFLTKLGFNFLFFSDLRGIERFIKVMI